MKRSLPTLPLQPGGDPKWDDYVSSCSDYFKRQLIVYQHWPQRKFGVLGYLEEKVFSDMNA